jgi:hypothetical protein
MVEETVRWFLLFAFAVVALGGALTGKENSHER